MMTLDTQRARFEALIEIVAERRQQGALIDPAWEQEIASLCVAHPEWLASPTPLAPPPVPVVAPPVPTFIEMPRAAVPHRPEERRPIEVDSDMPRIVSETLEAWGKRFCVFQCSGRLFEIQTESMNKSPSLKFIIRPPSMPRLQQVGSSRARSLAADVCQYLRPKVTKDGTKAPAEKVLPPEWLGVTITTLPSFDHIPVMNALVCAPTLRPDGALIWEKGYDVSSGIYLASDLKIQVPENPTQEDAHASATALLDLISDFSFTNPAGKSVWLAGVLSVAARHAFNGPVPIVIIDASKRGSGKSLLADVASVITRGVKASRMIYTDDDVEMDKRITSLALAGEQTVLIDNVVGKLASPPLDAAITSDSYSGRVLGKTEMPSMSMKIVWWVTGNGLVIGADMSRRAILARLEPDTDRPEDREGPRPGSRWKYPHLLDYTLEHRAELLGHALTIVRAYLAAGRPNQGLKPMGSFEAWSSVIRSAIVWAGAEDPCATVKDAREADFDDHALRMMVRCWPVKNGVVTASMLIEWAEIIPPLGVDQEKRAFFERTKTIREMWRAALLEWLPAKRGDLPTARELGYALRGIKGSVIGNYRIDALPHTSSGIPWQRVMMGGDDDQGDFSTGGPANLSVVK